MRDKLPNDETLDDQARDRQDSNDNGSSADDRCAIISGQIAHLLEKGYCLGWQVTTEMAAR
jgi:hypothetical protein